MRAVIDGAALRSGTEISADATAIGMRVSMNNLTWEAIKDHAIVFLHF